MDAEQLRSILTVAREFKVKRLGLKGEFEVEFDEASNYNKPEYKDVPATEKDADEQILAHIEKLKAEALAGTNQV